MQLEGNIYKINKRKHEASNARLTHGTHGQTQVKG